MTTIVALAENGTVYMGADSCVTNGYSSRTLGFKKIIEKGDLIIGITGEVKLIHLIGSIEVPPILRYSFQILTFFVPAVRQIFMENHVKDGDNPDAFDGMLLIGFHGRLYKLDGNYSLTTYTDAPFDAVGSGRDFALGALAVMGTRLAPEKRIRKALEAAARFDLYTRAPFQIVSK